MTRRGLNIVLDPWIPLNDRPQPASFAELLAGERDAADLDWPRDDFKVFTRLLLSALAQALFPARDAGELRARIERPLSKDEILDRLRPVAADFELLPEKGAGFLQAPRPTGKASAGAARFVFAPGDLFVATAPSEVVSLPVAAVTLFAEQTYAGGAGRGYGSGPAGQPGVFTLIDLDSVRCSTWANTLATALDTKPRPTRAPWSNAAQPARKRGSISLADGLFFQPRGIWLVERSSACGLTGVADRGAVALEGFQPKHGVDKDGVWIHPCAPMQLKSTGLAPLRLTPGQPAWTGLAQLLRPVSKHSAKAKDPNEGPALVLQQWWQLKPSAKARLIVLDYPGRDKAKLGSVLYERFPLSHALERAKDELHRLTDDAETVAQRLKQALTQAHDDQKRGGFATADAVSRFWTETEPLFVRWVEIVGDLEAPDQRVEDAHTQASRGARKAALRIFNEHVALSEWHLGKQERIATARRRLVGQLFGTSSTTAPAQREVRA
jgi:CRISPR type I-E-associated protein CasA/Cse1